MSKAQTAGQRKTPDRPERRSAAVRTMRRACWPACFVLAAACAVIGGAIPAPTAAPNAQRPRIEDFYYHEGRPVPLDRSPREYAVRFVAGTADASGRLRTLAPAAVPGDHVKGPGGEFRLISISSPDQRERERSLNRLRAAPDVECVVAVFYDRATRSRLIPTDEIVLKLRTGVSRKDFLNLVSTHGLILASEMPGTREQYVVRLADPKGMDSVEKARALYQSGRFEWVEPNFIRELKGAV